MSFIPPVNFRYPSFKTLRVFLHAMLFMALSAITATAATYYVSSSDPNASDSYTTPTSTAPWKTLAKVSATTFAPGDTIYLKCGDTWRETLTVISSGNAANRITFTSYGTGAKPVISGADLLTGWTPTSGGTANTYQATLTGTTPMVTCDSTYIKRGGSPTTLAANQYYWASNVLYINVGGDPSTHTIEVARRNNPVVGNTSRNYITLLGLRMEKSNLANVFIYRSNFWTVQNCDLFFGNSNNSLSGAGIHAGTANDLLLTGNHVNYALGDGIMIWYGLRAQVTSNLIENVLDDGGNPGADGIQIGALSTDPNACDNFQILNNTVSRPSTNVEKGCIIAEMGDNGIISGNNCTSGKFGIALSSNNGVISYNYVTGVGTNGSIRVSQDMPLSGIQIYYNVVTNSPGFYGIWILDDQDSKGNHASRSNFTIANNVLYNTYYGVYITEAFSGTICNNIAWSTGANPRARLNLSSIIPGQTLVCDNNIWQKQGTDIYISLGGTPYTTLAAWQTATGYDMHSTTANPMWVSPSTYDFHLLAGSPAIDTGAATSYTLDFGGGSAPQGAGMDMGAYEYGALYAYEGFNYTAGSDLNGANGGTGWASAWASSGGAGGTTVLGTGFTYTGLPVAGGAFQIYDTDGTDQQVTRTLNKTFGASPETYWISFLGKKLNSGREAYVNFGGLGLRAYQGNAWDIKMPTGSYTTITGANSASLHMFLIRVDAGATTDTVRVWLDPVLASGEPAVSSALVTLSGTHFTFNTLSILHGPFGDATQCGEYDEFRLASSFQTVMSNQVNTNVALGQTTATDSVNGTYVGANAVDGNIISDTSRWVSANTAFPHWIEVDFPVPRTINEIRFYTGYQGYNYPIAAYTLQRWDAGTSSWATIVSRTGNTNASVDENFTSVTTSKVRLYATQGSVDNYLRLYEIMVMGY